MAWFLIHLWAAAFRSGWSGKAWLSAPRLAKLASDLIDLWLVLQIWIAGGRSRAIYRSCLPRHGGALR
jgi:hypothetical protein